MRQPRIRELTRGEEAAVCDLVARGFDEFVASDFGPGGIANFRSFSSVEALAGRVGQGAAVLVAEDRAGRLVGMVETTPSGDHVTMLFVDTRRQGIGRRLMEEALLRCRRSHPEARRVTVHASRYAVPCLPAIGLREPGPGGDAERGHLPAHGVPLPDPGGVTPPGRVGRPRSDGC